MTPPTQPPLSSAPRAGTCNRNGLLLPHRSLEGPLLAALQAQGKSRLVLAWEAGVLPAPNCLSPSGEDRLKPLWNAAWGPCSDDQWGVCKRKLGGRAGTFDGSHFW